jgi:hypothetical protein
MENMINKLIELSISNGWEYEIEGPDNDDEMVLFINDENGNDFVMRYDDEGFCCDTEIDGDDSCWIGWGGTKQYEEIEKLVKSIFVG